MKPCIRQNKLVAIKYVFFDLLGCKYVSLIWIFVAFLFGYLAKQITLPPLVGYLCAGFILHAAGFVPEPSLKLLADLGITLMLFTIGLKVDFRGLIKPSLWVSTLTHMSAWSLLLLPLLMLSTTVVSAQLFDLSLSQCALVAFTFSFDSKAQQFKPNTEVGILLGTSYYLGDLNTTHFHQPLPAAGLIIRKNIDKTIFIIIILKILKTLNGQI